jgi:hypothetical protein
MTPCAPLAPPPPLSPQWVKLPRQTRVTPEEYREFISLGHGEIFNVDLDRLASRGAGGQAVRRVLSSGGCCLFHSISLLYIQIHSLYVAALDLTRYLHNK